MKKSIKKNNLKSALVNELKQKTILITGGAGSIGTILTQEILRYPIKQVRVIDIDEHSLFILRRKTKNNPKLRLLLGSILDKDRLERACNNVDIIIHLAAIKNIEISEFNPIETIDTNINGTVNLIKTIMKTKPKKFLNLSTDKAVESSTLYGATKLLSEKITTWGGIHMNPPTKFASIRFGNVIETKGNVFEIWKQEHENNKPISITDPKMKRYFFHITEAVEFILECIPLINTGEIFIPKMEIKSVKKLADEISKKQKIIGKRDGEKIQEVLMSSDEKKKVVEQKKMWIIKNHSNY
jgi:UDP-N-acetylglucosamine 4,6-dehydratase/5-epimerase